MQKNKIIAAVCLLSAINSYAGTMGEAQPSFYVYSGVQGGFSASHLGHYVYSNDYFTNPTVLSKGGTDSNNVVAADLGLAYMLADKWSWRSAFQYLYMPKTSFAVQENLSGLLPSHGGPQPPVTALGVINVASNTFFWNNMLQKEVVENLSIYAQGGIGFSHNTVSGSQSFYSNRLDFTYILSDGNYTTSSSNPFAWNAGAGIWYRVNKNINIDASYTYASFGKFNTGRGLLTSPANRISANLNRNLFMLGVQYQFPSW